MNVTINKALQDVGTDSYSYAQRSEQHAAATAATTLLGKLFNGRTVVRVECLHHDDAEDVTLVFTLDDETTFSIDAIASQGMGTLCVNIEVKQ